MRTLKVVIKTKPGYRQDGYSRGVMFILLAFDTVIRRRMRGIPRTLTLTAGTNDHSAGAHFRREAEDARSKSFRGRLAAQKKRNFLYAVMGELGVVTRTNETAHGYEVFTEHFYGKLEDEGEENEHVHVQVRIGHTISLQTRGAPLLVPFS